MSPTNRAVWLPTKQAAKMEVKAAPYTAPGKNEIVVKSRAIALNPVDYMLQFMGPQMAGWIKYPFIVGDDVAGEVYEVGPNVTRFKAGDRVVGHAVSMDKRANRACEGAFQEYVVLRTNLVSPIPESVSFEQASVLPLGLSTAACGLYMKDYLALQLPSVKTAKGSTGQTLLIWGGSTSVGANAIQLAVNSGYEVITTASPKNFAYVKSLGASQVYDYRDSSTIPTIKAALKDKKCAGALAIGDGSMEACISIIGSTTTGRKFIAQATLPTPETLPPKGLALVSFVAGFLGNSVSTSVKCSVASIGHKFIWGDDLLANEVGAAIYETFLPEALATGRYVSAPEAFVVGQGLEAVQGGLEELRKGVSGKKLVVTI